MEVGQELFVHVVNPKIAQLNARNVQFPHEFVTRRIFQTQKRHSWRSYTYDAIFVAVLAEDLFSARLKSPTHVRGNNRERDVVQDSKKIKWLLARKFTHLPKGEILDHI